jgi:hypothetical protein
MNKIKSVDHALEVLDQKTDFAKLSDAMIAAGMPESHVNPLIAHYQITVVIEANNKLNNWEIDWNDDEQYKYCVYKGISADASKPSGFGFSGTYYGVWCTYSSVGSRLHVGSRDEALYIGKDFEDLFEIAWLIIPEEK